MTDDLYERYKESLRVGHVAVLRGSLEAAVDAYRTAAEIAPSRALPHTSLGGVLLRLGKLDDALVEYAAAVARAPRDEGALLGQAEALGNAGRREEAAKALDQVSELQADSGRLPEAADTLRRAIELHETPRRTERQQELVRQVRLSAGDHAAEQLLARALRLRDESAPRSTAGEGIGARQQVASAHQPAMATPVEPATASQPTVAGEPQVEAVSVEPEAAGVEQPEPAGEAAATAGEPPRTDAAAEATTTIAAAASSGPLEVAGSAETASSAEAATARQDSGREHGPATLASRLRGWRGWWSEESEAEAAGRAASAEAPASPAAAEAPAEPTAPTMPESAAAAPDQAERDLEVAASEALPTEAAEPGSAFEATPEPTMEAAAEAAPESPAGTEEEQRAEPAVGAEPAAEAQPAPAAEPVAVMEEPAASESESGQSGDQLLAAAEAADLDGDAARLRTLLLDTARAYGRETRYEAAIDAANRVIRVSPSDLDAHFVLVELYMARDWNVLAVEKLELLARLADLSGDEAGKQRVCAAATAAYPKDERFGALCS